MITVEFVHPVPAHLGGSNDSLLNQAGKAPANANLGAAWHLGRHLACRQRFSGVGQDCKNGAV